MQTTYNWNHTQAPDVINFIIIKINTQKGIGYLFLLWEKFIMSGCCEITLLQKRFNVLQKLEACKCVAKVLKMTENRHDDFTGSGCNSLTGSNKLQIKCLDYIGSCKYHF